MARAGRPAQVSPGLRVEVQQLQRLARDAPEGSRLAHQPAQYPRAALGRFVEQDRAAVVLRRQGLGGQLGVLQLEHRLHPVLQRGHQRRLLGR